MVQNSNGLPPITCHGFFSATFEYSFENKVYTFFWTWGYNPGRFDCWLYMPPCNFQVVQQDNSLIMLHLPVRAAHLDFGHQEEPLHHLNVTDVGQTWRLWPLVPAAYMNVVRELSCYKHRGRGWPICQNHMHWNVWGETLHEPFMFNIRTAFFWGGRFA